MIEDFNARGIYLTEDEYSAGLRALFPEEYQNYSEQELEDILYERIAQLSPFEAESFFSSIGNFIKEKVAPVAVAALPAVATIAGTAIGGPVGAAAGGLAGKVAADAISKYGHVKPNPIAANVGQAATSIASGNYKAAIPSVINIGKSIGNAVSPGAGNQIANIATLATQAAGVGAPGAAPQQGLSNIASQAGKVLGGNGTNAMAGATLAQNGNPAPALSQLLGFIKSTPFLQNMLSTLVTGNLGTGVQMLKEDGSSVTTSYLEMLESLRQLTESAIAEADNAGIAYALPVETESEQEAYIETLVEAVGEYENALLPNYDSVTY